MQSPIESCSNNILDEKEIVIQYVVTFHEGEIIHKKEGRGGLLGDIIFI